MEGLPVDDPVEFSNLICDLMVKNNPCLFLAVPRTYSIVKATEKCDSYR